MQYSTLLFSALKYSADSTVHGSVVQCSAVQCSAKPSAVHLSHKAKSGQRGGDGSEADAQYLHWLFHLLERLEGTRNYQKICTTMKANLCLKDFSRNLAPMKYDFVWVFVQKRMILVHVGIFRHSFHSHIYIYIFFFYLGNFMKFILS